MLFFSSELGLTWSDTNDWLNLTSIQHIAVDNFGWYFDLEVSAIGQTVQEDDCFILDVYFYFLTMPRYYTKISEKSAQR